MSTSGLFLVIILFFILDLACLSVYLILKKTMRESESKRIVDAVRLSSLLEKKNITEIRSRFKNTARFLRSYVSIADRFSLSNDAEKTALKYAIEEGVFTQLIRSLNSRRPNRRQCAAFYLGYLPHLPVQRALVKALSKERRRDIKLQIVHSLVELNSVSAIPDIIDSLVGAPDYYKKKVESLLVQLGPGFILFIPTLIDRRELEVQFLLTHFADHCMSVSLKDFLETCVASPNRNLARSAARVLLERHAGEIELDDFLTHDDDAIRAFAVEALGTVHTKKNVLRLANLLNDSELREPAITALVNIIKNYPESLPLLLDRFYRSRSKNIRLGLAEVIAERLEYFLIRIYYGEKNKIRKLIADILSLGITSGVIDFLNRNHDLAIETEILHVIADVCRSNDAVKKTMQTSLKNALLSKLSYERKATEIQPSEKKHSVAKPWLVVILLFSFLLIPTIYVIRHWNADYGAIGMSAINHFVISFNVYFAFYSIAVNSVYLILLGFSVAELFRTLKIRRLVSPRMINREGLLPSVSIIAPAYNEEATIVENVLALLNLDYTDYEVIVVNDGSKDSTLDVLIETFDLLKVDIYYKRSLKTAQVKGIYRSKRRPRLTVVDKMNGGKADSLNAGINLSRKEYCCGIDADSILESKALKEATLPFLSAKHEVIATGGVIAPVNGCLVRSGNVAETGVAKNWIAVFQTIEYFRAFMAGRLGWASLDSLCIISGAFGIFKKSLLTRMRGYLTSSEFYRKDTVGEDMELVVRMAKRMREKKQKFSILFSPLAVCWTEVPQSMKILTGQRDRWQRGLIDVLLFHKRIFFNPTYGNFGMIAFPYFLIFEVIGPWIELQGYLFFILGIAFGLLNSYIVLLVFTATIAYGIFISIASLLISQGVRSFFPLKDSLRLIWFALIENFGFRQIMSFTRVLGYISSLKKSKGWGSMVRRGFRNKTTEKAAS